MRIAPPRSRAEEADWLRLIRSENVGPATFFSLLQRFGTAGAALDALPELAARGGTRRPIVIAKPAAVNSERESAQKVGAAFVFFGTERYPARLAAIHAPPPVIAVRGDIALLARSPLAIVGARKASAAGRTLAANFAEGFAEAGRAVVSGLALGIDAAAHRAALSGGTVAVVAGGVDRPTPDEHKALAEEILAAGGAVVSEMPFGLVPRARDYPRRNRLIAGLCDAVVVIEAAAASGSLHTARYAADENRDVYAVPGSPLDPRAAGCLSLLRSGALLAVEPQDVLSGQPAPVEPSPRLPGFAETTSPTATTQDTHAAILETLSITPIPVDVLVRDTGLPAGAVIAALTELELAGRCERDVDGTVRAAIEP
ncbi:MAG: DNA-processing protein DprA [Pseudomonadota bacterium]